MSAFATLRKQFNVITPTLEVADEDTCELARQFLKELRPYIRDGHVEQAQAAAAQFVAEHQPGQIQEG